MSPAPPTPLVLASASPRRAEILTMLGLHFEVLPARVPEVPRPGEEPEVLVERLARDKAGAVSHRRPEAWVLAGDTVVVHDGRVLGKPADAEEAVRMLSALSGQEHRVFTALALAEPGGRLRSGVAVARVRFRPVDAATIRGYVATGEPMDKAGAYGIQGLGCTLVTGVEGDYYTVVGLPVSVLVDLLAEAGRPWTFPPAPAGPPAPIPEDA